MKEHFCSAEKSLITYEGSCNWCGESEGSMTQDEIIAMARQVGYPIQHFEWQKATEEFAALVAAKEREACALICDKEVEDWKYDADVVDVAIAIRARGQA
jgi:hypothetical protein